MSQPQQELHEDGTPRRKYELEAREESRVGLHTAVGLALASGLMLMRNFIFGAPVDAQGSVQASAMPSSGGTVKDGEAIAPTPEEKDEEETAAGAKTSDGEGESLPNVSLSSPPTPVRIYDGPLAAAIAKRSSAALPLPANNDNEQLYGAAQGNRIDLSPLESSFDTDWSGFGGGGSAPRNEPPDRDKDPTPTRNNRLPIVTGATVLASLPMNQSTLIAAAELLRNVSDPDGDALQIQGLTASSGMLVARGDGLYAFAPATGDTTSVTFSYKVSDGEGSVVQVAHLDLLPITTAPVLGSPENDTIVGTPTGDIIDGLDGDDRIIGREGNDAIYGGAGNDSLLGDVGDDVIHGGSGNDVIWGGAGNDRLFGGEGDDILLAEAGDDALFGEDGDDHLLGGSGADVLLGGAGGDILDGGAGDDRVFGEDGDDVILAAAGDGNDQVDGGDGTDTYDASDVQEAVTIDLHQGTATGETTGQDTLASIENAIGGGGDDVIVANHEVNELTGNAGNDIFTFRSWISIGKGPGGRDKILDFEVGDRIDLDDISDEFEDAVEDHFEDQNIRKFVLIGQQEEFTRPGQLRFKYDQIDEQALTIIEGNIDHDAETEFELELRGTYTLRSEQFET